MKWNVKEGNHPTVTLFFIRKGRNVVGIIKGQNRIEGDIEKMRLRANQIVNNKRREEMTNNENAAANDGGFDRDVGSDCEGDGICPVR